MPTTVDLSEIEKKVEAYLKNLFDEYDELTKVPVLAGVQNFSPEAVTLRIKIKTVSMQHTKMAGIIRRDLLTLLEEYDVKVEGE